MTTALHRQAPALHLNTASAAAGQHDDARLTGRSSSRPGSSRPGSSRLRSARARVSLSDQAFKGRAEGAVNLFPNPLFENSNASLAYTDRSHGAGRSEPGTPSARRHSGGSATRFSTSYDVGGKIAMESRGWRSPERDFAVPSPRQIRIRGRGGRVQLPPSSYGKDEFAGAGEYAHPAAHGPYSAFGVLEPGVELKAGTRQDPISKQEHVRKLFESGKITTSKHNVIRDTPQHRQVCVSVCGSRTWSQMPAAPAVDGCACMPARMRPRCIVSRTMHRACGRRGAQVTRGRRKADTLGGRPCMAARVQ